MKIKLIHTYDDIISLDNLLLAWQEFLLGKRGKKDVQDFSLQLMDNIISLHTDLKNCTYQHGCYEDFFVTDPKRRHIHKASVRDRLLHHAVYRNLYPFFDRTFIADSFSCRNGKGVHRALNRFRLMYGKASKNNTCTCWVLKCDIKKFFDSIDHIILLEILSEYVCDLGILQLLKNTIESYKINCHPRLDRGSMDSCGSLSSRSGDENDSISGVGLPLGNLTSQLFANIYMNVFDQFVKHKLKVKYYIRYADDFVFLSSDKEYLESLILEIKKFLGERLKLTLHPNKTFLQTVASGVDFLGWVHFTKHRILRKTTHTRMLNRVTDNPKNETIQSYLGMLKHGNGYKLQKKLLNR